MQHYSSWGGQTDASGKVCACVHVCVCERECLFMHLRLFHMSVHADDVSLQVVTGKSVCNLKADSPNLLEEWLRVLQSILRIKAASPLFTHPDTRPIMKGHLTKVYC